MHSTRPMRDPRAAARCGRVAAPVLALALLTGCPPDDRGPRLAPPRDAREALQRVNDNLGRIRDALVYKRCTVSFRFRDAEGRGHAFIAQPASMIYRAPRLLRFAVSGLTGNVAMVGSNDERYWVWIEPEVSTMWWGTWRGDEGRGARHASAGLPLPPSELLSALALQVVPAKPAGGFPPLLDRAGPRPRLVYVRLAEDGWPYVAREIALDNDPPHQPVEIVHRDATGRTVMRASLGGYARVGREGPFTPRRYVIEWPLDGAELRLDVGSAALRADQPPFAAFPTDPPVRRVECLDDEPDMRGESPVSPN